MSSTKPNFAAMPKSELRAYVLAHRDDEGALQAYLNRLHSENVSSRIYKANEDVSEAITEYLRDNRQQ